MATKPNDKKTRSIGIDLGTTNSCVATVGDDGRPEIIVDPQGQRTLPSCVSFRDAAGNPKVAVGEPAKRQMVSNPRETVYAAKRLIGRRFDDPEVQRLRATLSYGLTDAPNGDAWIEVTGEKMPPQVISARVLDTLRNVAEEHFGNDTEVEAIITVPAYFDDTQRRSTKDAAEIAGLRVRRLLNEPTAAALGYGAHQEPAGRFAVCDLGGGTFDVSIVNVEDGVFEVISTHGDIMLGGDDFDRRIFGKLAAEIQREHRLDVAEDATALQRLLEEAQSLKHALSQAAEVKVHIPHLGRVGGKPLDYQRKIGRVEIEAWTEDIVERLANPCLQALSNARLRASDIDQVLLVGGMTRMPAVQRKLEELFGRPPTKSANPDEVVAIGAATQCAILDGYLEDVILLDVTSRTLGMHGGGGKFVPLIPRNATIPTREHRIVATTEDDQSDLAIDIYEGEFNEVSRNRHLGTFHFSDLPEAPAGEILVMVDFTVDVDGILRVSARDLATGEASEVRGVAATGLARSEVRRRAAELRKN